MSTAQATEPLRPEQVTVDGVITLPTSHPIDAEADVEVLKALPKRFEVNDEKSANWLVKRIQQSREYSTRVKAWSEQELRRAAREESTLLFLFGRQIEAWAKGEIAKMNGRRKSFNLPAGCIGFRTSPTRLVVDDESSVIAWAKQHLPPAVVVVEKLSKTTLNDYAQQTGVIPDAGVHVEPQGERFFIR